MNPIPLSTFLTFVSSSGLSKYNVADDLEDYDPAHDWYKAFREAAVPAIEAHDPTVLGNLPNVLKDDRKVPHYTDCGEALGKWIETTSYEVLDIPPGRVWTHGDLPARVNPEVRLRIGDNIYLLKLYMRKHSMRKPGLDAYGYLVQQTFGKEFGWPAVLDVRKRTPLRPAPPPTLKIVKMRQ